MHIYFSSSQTHQAHLPTSHFSCNPGLRRRHLLCPRALIGSCLLMSVHSSLPSDSAPPDCDLEANVSVLFSQLLPKNLCIAQTMIFRKWLINILSNNKEARLGAGGCFENKVKGELGRECSSSSNNQIGTPKVGTVNLP